MDDSTKAELVQGAVSAGGKVVVMQGGNGELTAKLSFNDDGKLVNRQTELHVRAVDWQKASVIASRIFVSRKLLKSSPPVEPVKEKTWNDSTWDLGQ